MRSVRCAVTRGAIAAQRVCRPARAFSTSRVEDGQPQHEYLAAFHNTMDELALLGYCAGADLTEHKQFIDAVVLPLRRTYAWGVPSAHALQAIAEVSPHGVVEIGAGTGYWAHLLEQQGVSVRAYDSAPLQFDDHINGFHALANLGNALPFARVSDGGAEAAGWHPERTLLLCWPPRESDGSGTGDRDVAMMASDALAHYNGNTVAYVGVCRAAAGQSSETVEQVESGGTNMTKSPDASLPARFDTAGESFESSLSEQFDLVRQVVLPNWPPLSDSLTLWRRKEASVPSSAAPVIGSAEGAEVAGAVDGADVVPPEELTAARRSLARAATLDEIRWTGFGRGWVLGTLARWARRRRSGEAAAESAEEVEMLRRCLARAPWAPRLLGRMAARRLEVTFD